MKRRPTFGEWARMAYFFVSFVSVMVTCENIPVACVAVANMAVAAWLLRKVNVDELIDD